MERTKVYGAIDTERNYQDEMTQKNPEGRMVDNFDISHTLLNIELFTQQAKEKWYSENPEVKYQQTMEMLRKIAGVCVKMGEKYGMPNREFNVRQYEQ